MHEPVLNYVASTDGVDVAVHDYGGDGPTALFVHGTGMCARMWEPVVRRLAPASLRVLTVDLRGHGLTKTPPDVTFFDDRMVSDVVAVIDAFEVAGGIGVAHSMGAATTILASLDRPAAMKRIWAYEPIIMAPQAEGIPAEFLAGVRNRRAIYSSRQAAFDRYSTRPPLDELHPDVLWAYLEHGFGELGDGTVALRCQPEQEALAFEQFLQDGFSKLSRVNAEVLVAFGEADQENSPALSAPEIAAAMPNGLARGFPGRLHFGPFADPDITAESILEFLDPW